MRPWRWTLVAEAAAVTTPNARRLLDVGCGAGNYTLKLLGRLPHLDVMLVDLSRPMLDKAQERIRAAQTALLDKPAVAPAGSICAIQRRHAQIDFGEATFDIIVASATLHHLRTDSDWHATFAKFHRALSLGGSLWIFDLIANVLPGVQRMMDRRYAEYLDSLGGPDSRREVLAYIDKEDTPRPLVYQLELLRKVGFSTIEVLHQHGCFAAFGAVK